LSILYLHNPFTTGLLLLSRHFITHDPLGDWNSNVVGTETTFLIKSVANTGLESGTLGGIIITLVLSLHLGCHPLNGFSKE